MGRWAQAQRRGGAVNTPLAPPSTEFLEIVLPDENQYSISYTGAVPGGVNQMETELELVSVGSGADAVNGGAAGPCDGITCNVAGTDPTPRAAQMRARWLFSGTPVTVFSDWTDAGLIQCV